MFIHFLDSINKTAGAYNPHCLNLCVCVGLTLGVFPGEEWEGDFGCESMSDEIVS